MAMATFFLCLSLLELGLSQEPSAEMLSELIPASFPTQDLSRYTVRYLSQASGSADSEACLRQQPPLSGANATQQSCSTIRYSLSGGNRTGTMFFGNSYLILVVSKGRYPYIGNIQLWGFSNIIVAKNPLEANETVFMCDQKNYTGYNNMYFVDAKNIAFIGITFSNCGPFSPGFTFTNASNTVIDGCSFR